MGPCNVSQIKKPDHLIISLSLSLYSIKCLLNQLEAGVLGECNQDTEGISEGS